MKVQKIIDSKESFKPYKILIEISVEHQSDDKVIKILKKNSSYLYLADEVERRLYVSGFCTGKEEEFANELVQNILSNL